MQSRTRSDVDLPKTKTHSIHVRLTPDVHEELTEYVKQNRTRGSNFSTAINEAIRSYLKPDDQMEDLSQSINRIEIQLATTRTRTDMLGRVLLHYLRYYFIHFPDIPAEASDLARVQSDSMFAKFLRSVRRRLDDQDLFQILDRSEVDNVIQELQDLVTRTLTLEELEGDKR